jgi:hypothetical protein
MKSAEIFLLRGYDTTPIRILIVGRILLKVGQKIKIILPQETNITRSMPDGQPATYI